MELVGSRDLNAPREEVWRALNDPEVLARAIPGCESIQKIDETTFDAVAAASVGPVKARFKGRVSLQDLDPPNGYRIAGEGQGGVAGFAKGEAAVTLDEIEGGTRLNYAVKAQVGGKLAQVGQRLIDGAAKKMADEFFQNFAGIVAPTPAPSVETAATTSPPMPVPAAGGLPQSIWIPFLVAGLALLIALVVALG
ncbi:MAG: carbon monoxide dehydrogenase [Alphaproteobacteria bacterium]|nr:carbon monoxide dehydrogenase [Alphaproteobacteria bacterium]